ncbi:MAG: DUF3800 domain-containing protein [Candidatus Didemnitutus sp.]|nr:DUF3800 domain-containing protein [Candidatus Didemnitutus sp.]
MPSEYTFFCDESIRRGPFFSNFYGGVRVSSDHIDAVNASLKSMLRSLGLTSEVKWTKVDANLVERYESMMDAFFAHMQAGRVHMRVMFTQNIHEPVGLSKEQLAEQYFILYYQFLKHAFGLTDMPAHPTSPRLRIYLDEMGETKEKVAKFRGFVGGLSSMTFRHTPGVILDQSDITEVRSHDHVLMQCLDVVLGAISFRLNNMHQVIPEGQHRRGKRTVAKEKLYRHIHKRICATTGKKHFNIGISTGLMGGHFDSWSAPYAHWRFVPKEYRINPAHAKP